MTLEVTWGLMPFMLDLLKARAARPTFCMQKSVIGSLQQILGRARPPSCPEGGWSRWVRKTTFPGESSFTSPMIAASRPRGCSLIPERIASAASAATMATNFPSLAMFQAQSLAARRLPELPPSPGSGFPRPRPHTDCGLIHSACWTALPGWGPAGNGCRRCGDNFLTRWFKGAQSLTRAVENSSPPGDQDGDPMIPHGPLTKTLSPGRALCPKYGFPGNPRSGRVDKDSVRGAPVDTLVSPVIIMTPASARPLHGLDDSF